MAKNGQEERSGGKILSVIIIFLIIVIWLAAMILLIKFDVGNFGSQVLRPVLKDVPVINMILPAATNDEAIAETNQPYRTLAEALLRIDALELENKDLIGKNQNLTDQIYEKDTEIQRLKVLELDYEEFNQLKNEFYDEVVYGNNAPDADTYIEWYESIDPEAAEEIYRQVIASREANNEIKELAITYAEMEPANAADILQTMSGDLDTVALILKNMSSSDKAEIMAEMEPEFAANITKKLLP